MTTPYEFRRVNIKAWGAEYVIADEPAYCGKLMELKKDYQCSIHRHLKKDETFYLLSGEMRVELFPEDAPLKIFKMTEGQSLRVPPLLWHRFRGLTDCRFLEFSTHDSPEDNERRTQSGPVS